MSTPDDELFDHTIDADESTLAHLRELARAAEVYDEPDPPRAWHAVSDDVDVSDDRVPGTPERALDVPGTQAPDGFGERDERARHVEVPAPPAREREPWRPPARSMRPVEPPITPHHASPVWRWATIVLAAVLVVVLAWVLLSGGDGDEPPPEQPGVTTVEAGVVNTGSVTEGGGGGG